MPLPPPSLRRTSKQKDNNLFLDDVLSNARHPTKPTLVLLEYDVSSSPWPLVRQLLQESSRTLILALSNARNDLFGNRETDRASDVDTFLDWTEHVPGFEAASYGDRGWMDLRSLMNEALERATLTTEASQTPLTVLVDSVDTLLDDIGSTSAVQRFLSDTLRSLSCLPGSRLVLPIHASSALLPLIIPISFSQHLAVVTLYSPTRVRGVWEMYMVTPNSDEARFWKLLQGSGPSDILSEEREWREGVVKVFTRTGSGKGSGTNTTLEGWAIGEDGLAVACRWDELVSLRGLTRSGTDAPNQVVSDEKQAKSSLNTLPFNLSLTESQQEAKAQVPLPYAHQGQDLGMTIHYDPDSADDMDDEDPDEDLDL
ncbi:hypothetical protein FRB95_006817 [Tulasnella sp. JGI-2019a]|nr:hypothetical protein FRB95_006817 [Tulasnella sp. JGI-2019a]